jgi:hypothetical protein
MMVRAEPRIARAGCSGRTLCPDVLSFIFNRLINQAAPTVRWELTE